MNQEDYKPVSSMAIISLAGSTVGLVAFFALPMLTLTLVSLAIAVASIFRIRQREMSGSKLAIASISLATVTLMFAPVWHSYLFNSESLAGYLRVDLPAMELDRSGNMELDRYANKRICVKGYMVPIGKFKKLQTFQLSSDGNINKPEGSITISLSTNLIDYRHAPMAVSGILTVDPEAKDPAQRYFLSADFIRPCYTSRGLAPRSGPRGC